jgi:hypothetical protein
MKIRIKDNARSYYISLQNCHHQSVNWHWAKVLELIAGQVLEVETKFLFRDQFNTAPYDGPFTEGESQSPFSKAEEDKAKESIQGLGLRVMAYSVEEVINDARPGMGRCGWCGKTVSQDEPCHEKYIAWFEGETA